MNTPAVSVMMPVYNAAPFLRLAIDSVLTQTFTDFEFIIINDGSSDTSKEIIESYTDNRIIFLENEKNCGLLYTLNKGIDAANGRYIARMDADDICLRERLETQINFFKTNPEAKVLASTIILVNEKGEQTGNWDDDVNNTTVESIKHFLPFNNCIAHPSIMIATSVLKEYRYNVKQKLSEDYDLWLRLVAAGIKIHKLQQPLLFHRILYTSFTRTTGRNHFFKLMKVKTRFVVQQIAQGKINSFIIKTFLWSLMDFIKGIGKIVKRKLTSLYV